jgi:hypothetical protein
MSAPTMPRRRPRRVADDQLAMPLDVRRDDLTRGEQLATEGAAACQDERRADLATAARPCRCGPRAWGEHGHCCRCGRDA